MGYFDSPAYEKAYETKKADDGVYAMNEFCSAIHGKVGTESIPNLLRLFYDGAITCEQNEFVAEVIGSIFEKAAEECTKAIVDNILILEEEDAEECLFHLLLVLVYWNPTNTECFIRALKNTEKEKRAYFVAYMKYRYEEKDDDDGVLEEILARL